MEEWERLLDELRAEFVLREKELELLHEIDLRILDSRKPLDETLSFVVRRTQTLLQSEHIHVLLRRGRRDLETVYSSAQVDIGQLVPIGQSLTGRCLTENAIITIADLTHDAYRDLYVRMQDYDGPDMVSLMAVPIRLNDAVIGVLNAESIRPNAFQTVHERISTSIAAQVAIALQRAPTFDPSALAAEVDQLMFAGNGTHHVLQVALNKVMDALHRLEYVELSGAQIMFQKSADELEIVYSTNPSDVGLTVAISGSISGRAVRERRTVVVGDVGQDPDYRRMLGPAIKSEIAVPILFGEHDVLIGVLNVESEELDVFGGFYELILQGFADKVKTLLAFTKLRNDVTEALEVRHANDLLVAVGDQTSHIIHRLNNTVGAMRVRILELQSMHGDKSLDEGELKESLQALLALADRTLDMPQEVTRFLSRDRDSANVNDCVRTAVGGIDVPGNVDIDLDLQPGIPPLSLYSFDIVVQNLIQNAIDAMPEGGRLTVATSLVSHPESAGGYMLLAVRDSGVGIPDHIKDQVFMLNFTTKREKQGKGLGLGLWWVRTFVRRAGGDITFTSNVGAGTEVMVKIPMDRSTGTLLRGR